MRRLAKQDREDRYSSRRDYQQLHEVTSFRVSGAEPVKTLEFSREVAATALTFVGFGGFLRTPQSSELLMRVEADGETYTKFLHTGTDWSRIGAGVRIDRQSLVRVKLTFAAPQEFVDTFGLTIGLPQFPRGTLDGSTSLAEVNASHLVPETLYLDHIGEGDQLLRAAGLNVSDGAAIVLKKCSYCSRQLPAGPGQGQLSFHKHNAKISGHQNECRACKKWKINNSFNPLRTVDQLNESSLITRERRLLLREPDILRSIKEREGRGLKSIVWERFGKKCFYCDKPLTLKQVELDHTRPLAYLWPIDEFATCLCSEHNNHKKDKFPVEFYTQKQLERLSQITGLPLRDLKSRSVCQPQLTRIRTDIGAFASECDPRAFNAIARKVRELQPDTDLWLELENAAPEVYERVLAGSLERPESVTTESSSEQDEFLDALEE